MVFWTGMEMPKAKEYQGGKEINQDDLFH